MSGNTGHFAEMIAEIKLKLCLFVPTRFSAISYKLLKRLGVPLGDSLNQLVQIRLVLFDLSQTVVCPTLPDKDADSTTDGHS